LTVFAKRHVLLAEVAQAVVRQGDFEVVDALAISSEVEQ